VELSPAHRWGPGVHTLAVSGPLLMVGAALLASGRNTRWVLRILGCYVLLVSVLGDLPLIFNPDVGGSAITELLINLLVMGAILYWFYGAKPALLTTNSAPLPPAGRPPRFAASPACPTATSARVCD
jgi:hypothetical protein